MIIIPFIMKDEDTVQIIDELKHRLKTRAGRGPTPIADDLDAALNEIIKKHGLDSDPHAFATLPPKKG